MLTEKDFVILKGEPKTLEIETIEENGSRTIVNFKNGQRPYMYNSREVVWIKDGAWHDTHDCKIYINGIEKKDVTEIRSYKQEDKTHWRITYSSGKVTDYLHGTIYVAESCLADVAAKNVFDYLKHVAETNQLGRESDTDEKDIYSQEDKIGILRSIYNRVEFIDKDTVASAYLFPLKYKVKKSRAPRLIFPFGCNASQEKAVKAAFENQLSVIQGPPGTGKTQTILNIIANIIMQGKTVMIVSSNNSATENVQEKLEKYGFGFFVAPLGKKENKEAFIQHQPAIPQMLNEWKLDAEERKQNWTYIDYDLSNLEKAFVLQEQLALAKQEIKDVELEWDHFKKDNNYTAENCIPKEGISSERYMSLWMQYQSFVEKDEFAPKGFFSKLLEKIRWRRMNRRRKHLLGINAPFDQNNLRPIILELQALYYIVRIKELQTQIHDQEEELNNLHAKELNDQLAVFSKVIFKDALYEKYHAMEEIAFTDLKELWTMSDTVLRRFPVILSTTFSARISLSDQTIYDYVIMDEASQVSVETGALALTCAKNAVIVGDNLQLPNVITNQDRLNLNAIFQSYKIAQGYNSAEYSFLKSVCTVIPDVKQTLLREHYRCHPKIINFCNQKFYGGKLLIMTEDQGERDVLAAIHTVPGNHSRGHFNQREIDVVKQEVLPHMGSQDIGIITPYNIQVDAFRHEIPSIEAATVHKYQGREKDSIIMSVVDNQFSDFTDDPNLLNVAISRAKKQFCIVLSGNEQQMKGNISELVDYISYNDFSVTNSKISSIFDYLYSHYTEQRIALLANMKKISNEVSENLTYNKLYEIINENNEFSHLGILCHTPLRNVIRDWSLLNEDEQQYISHYTTHLDFLIISHVTKKPILAIETDGFNFHNEKTEQHQRDLKKDHILELYGLPLIRLSTVQSGEKTRIVDSLRQLI